MSENRMGFRFHAQAHGPPAGHIGLPKPDLEPIKQPNSHEHSTSSSSGRRFGFPSTMFQKGDKNNAWPDRAVITDGGWVRPSPTGWALPPEEPLVSVAKNSNASAGNIRRSSAAIAGGGNRLPAMKKATVLETIDSTEAAKKYGGRFMF